MKDRTAENLKSLLNLVPLSIEGGYFAETYRSADMISKESLPDQYSGPRTVGTCYGQMVPPSECSLAQILRMAWLPSLSCRTGCGREQGWWAGGRFALLGCTVSPGFEYADYESGSRKLLCEGYPEHRDLICALTRS
jgi:hypothetical protein